MSFITEEGTPLNMYQSVDIFISCMLPQNVCIFSGHKHQGAKKDNNRL